MRSGHRAQRLVYASAGFLSAAIFWCRAVAQLHVRHPHEDAFILFRYAENLAHGAGIVFNISGPPTEGATDFLWMVMLAAGVRLGVDVAVAAAFLNACGCGILAAALTRLLLMRRQLSVPELATATFLACSTPFLAGAHASCDGFSALTYSALAVSGYSLTIADGITFFLATPYAALVLGLFRPDGLILGLGLVVFAFFRKRHHPGILRRLAYHSTGAVVVGIGYFLWRWHYFGELLPLPLYVKSRGSGVLPGWESNRDWLLDESGMPALLAATLLVGFFARSRGHLPRRVSAALGGMLCGMLLYIGLLFAHQSQNVDNRFQAPVFSVFEAGLLSMLGYHLSKQKTVLARGAWSLGVCLALLPALGHGRKVWPLDYLDGATVAMGDNLRGVTVAVTEAGRLPYWTHANAIDIVGLNDRRAATKPPNPEYIASLQPDLILFHSSGILDEGSFRELPASAREGQAVLVPAAELRAAIRSPYHELMSSARRQFPLEIPVHRLAAAALATYVAGSKDFDVLLLRYGAGFRHVWAIRRNRAFTATVEQVLRTSADRRYVSYAEAKGIRVGSAACVFLSKLADLWGVTWLGWPNLPTCSATTPLLDEPTAREPRAPFSRFVESERRI